MSNFDVLLSGNQRIQQQIAEAERARKELEERQASERVEMVLVSLGVFAFGLGGSWFLKRREALRKKNQSPPPTNVVCVDSPNPVQAKVPAEKAANVGAIDPSLEERAYELALKELESGSVRAGFWAKALAETDGDEKRAKARYLAIRAKSAIAESGFTETVESRDGSLHNGLSTAGAKDPNIPTPMNQIASGGTLAKGVGIDASRSADLNAPEFNHAAGISFVVIVAVFILFVFLLGQLEESQGHIRMNVIGWVLYSVGGKVLLSAALAGIVGWFTYDVITSKLKK